MLKYLCQEGKKNDAFIHVTPVSMSFSTIVLTCLEDNCESCYKITFRRTTRFWSDMRKIRIFGKTWEWLLKLLMYWFLMLVYKSLGLTMTKRTIFVSRLQCFWFILYRDVSFVDQINTRRFGLFNLNTVRYHPMSPYRNGGGGGWSVGTERFIITTRDQLYFVWTIPSLNLLLIHLSHLLS